MKFYIIRHAKVNMRWPKKCTSDEFNQACKKYDEADIVAFQGSLELPVSNIYIPVNLSEPSKQLSNCFPCSLIR